MIISDSIWLYESVVKDMPENFIMNIVAGARIISSTHRASKVLIYDSLGQRIAPKIYIACMKK